MTERTIKPTGVCTLALLFTVAACAPAADTNETLSDAMPAAAAYISNKLVSTDCGVDAPPPPPPGWARPPGRTAKKMAPPRAAQQAVGADRPIAETIAGKVSPGVTMIDLGYRKPFYLINNDKEVIGEFAGDYYSFMQLLPNGNILGSSNMYSDTFRDGGGSSGCIEEYRPDGSLVWRLALATDDYIHHHDLQKLDNGNVLAATWERVSTDEIIALGRNPEHVAENGDFWFDGFVEVNPLTAEIVWEWSIKNHLIQDFDPNMSNYGVVADNPGKLDINAIHFSRDGSVGPDWTHVNALDYNEELDQIIFSSNYMWEVYVIDHSITAFEAQGDAGDFLYRWGNQANYLGDDEESAVLFAQHDVHWIPEGLPGAGNIMIFNNGVEPERPYSTVVEFTPDMNADGSYNLGEDGAYGPTDLAWEYVPKEGEEFFSWFISGAQRLPNGNTLVNHGADSRMREVTPEGDIVWEYQFDDGADGPHMTFRAYRYPEDHPAVLAITERNADSPSPTR
jgi:hypothetical protein